SRASSLRERDGSVAVEETVQPTYDRLNLETGFILGALVHTSRAFHKLGDFLGVSVVGLCIATGKLRRGPLNGRLPPTGNEPGPELRRCLGERFLASERLSIRWQVSVSWYSRSRRGRCRGRRRRRGRYVDWCCKRRLENHEPSAHVVETIKDVACNEGTTAGPPVVPRILIGRTAVNDAIRRIPHEIVEQNAHARSRHYYARGVVGDGVVAQRRLSVGLNSRLVLKDKIVAKGCVHTEAGSGPI